MIEKAHDRCVMAAGRHENQGVPDRIVIWQTPPINEDHTARVQDASDEKQQDRGSRQRGEQLVGYRKKAPTEYQIEDDCSGFATARVGELETSTTRGHNPNAQEQPSSRAVRKEVEREWRISAGDHDVNDGMIEQAKQFLARRVRR